MAGISLFDSGFLGNFERALRPSNRSRIVVVSAAKKTWT